MEVKKSLQLELLEWTNLQLFKLPRFKFFMFLMLNVISVFGQNIDKISSSEAVHVLGNLNKGTSVIIDGRDSARFFSGHIKGAIYIDAYNVTAPAQLVKYLDKNTIFLYCTTNRRSETIIELLRQLDYGGKIINMTDGIKGWTENGYSLE